MSYIKEYEDDVEALILNNSGFLLIDCYAEWCGPCKQFVTMVEKQVANPFPSNLQVVKVEISELESFKSKYGIKSVPTFLLFEDDVLISTIFASDLTKVLQWIRNNIGDQK